MASRHFLLPFWDIITDSTDGFSDTRSIADFKLQCYSYSDIAKLYQYLKKSLDQKFICLLDYFPFKNK